MTVSCFIGVIMVHLSPLYLSELLVKNESVRNRSAQKDLLVVPHVQT